MTFDWTIYWPKTGGCKTDPFTPTGKGTTTSPFYNADQVYEQHNVVKYPYCPTCLMGPAIGQCACGVGWTKPRIVAWNTGAYIAHLFDKRLDEIQEGILMRNEHREVRDMNNLNDMKVMRLIRPDGKPVYIGETVRYRGEDCTVWGGVCPHDDSDGWVFIEHPEKGHIRRSFRVLGIWWEVVRD